MLSLNAMKILGLDYGTKTIGVALSDEFGLTAQPLETLKTSGARRGVDAVVNLTSKHGVDLIVVGMPFNMDGSVGERAKATRSFIRALQEKSGLPVIEWDERLSTVAVNRVLIEADSSRKKRKEAIDKLAAAYILQGYLDSLKPAGRASA